VRQLHVLGVSDDGAALLLGTSETGKPTHRVLLDDRLRAAVRGQLSTPGSDRVESALPPREIQARLRAGETPEAVAKAAGVPLARVVPYAAPVIAERDRVVEEARSAPVTRARGPQATRPLGEAVDAKLADVPGFKPDSVEWAARRRPDGAWVVSVDYAARGGRRSATWLWQPADRELTAEDLAASRLAADGTPAKRGGRGTGRGDRAGSPRSGRTAKPAAGKPARKRVAAKRAAKPGSGSKPVPPKSAAATNAKPAAATRTAAAPEAPGVDAAAAPRGGGRVPVPSWSDVLLGVAPPQREDAPARQPGRKSGRRKG
jgi:Protein of unknown function (DUF3071)